MRKILIPGCYFMLMECKTLISASNQEYINYILVFFLPAHGSKHAKAFSTRLQIFKRILVEEREQRAYLGLESKHDARTLRVLRIARATLTGI